MTRFRRRSAVWLLATLLLLLPLQLPAQAPKPVQARIAVASNFADVARALARDYGKRTGHRIEISAASTG